MDNRIDFYQQRLNLQDASWSRIEHDDAIVSIVYKVTQPIGPAQILKICLRPEEYERELYFLNYFAGKLPVPRVIDVVPPEENIHGAILMGCLPGSTLKVADVTDELSYDLGVLFARIHLNRVIGFGDVTRPGSLVSDARDYFALQFETGFDECSKHLPIELLEKCRKYYQEHCNFLASVDGPCLVHRDFRPGNVMVRDGKVQGIIDWATSRASFAEEDFRSMEHCWEWEHYSVHLSVAF